MQQEKLDAFTRRFSRNTYVEGTAAYGKCVLYDTLIAMWDSHSITIMPIPARFRTQTTLRRINELLDLTSVPQRLHKHTHAKTGETLLFFSGLKRDRWHDNKPRLFCYVPEPEDLEQKLPINYRIKRVRRVPLSALPSPLPET